MLRVFTVDIATLPWSRPQQEKCGEVVGMESAAVATK